MKKILVTLIAALFITVAAQAQDYKTGIGFRGGLSNGLTVKHFISGNTALEGLLSTRWGGFHLTGLYEIHAPAFSVNGLHWYYGVGGHLGSWQTNSKNPWWNDDDSHTVIGIDGIVGIEYNIGAIPFNISLDYKPGFNLIGHTGFWGDEFALSIRYVWGSR
jgi:hypothetical protein